ncbi:MFS transporter [Natrarchaeobius halalkaliphilus]|uniref:MFS transporter n=1 Tax=Natrarchaeobius halalkaliphilus TaxID=1679091 RepID=A0A3N6LK80_9EURY|nr:MFS transporter [Natrarchaeobius halalkaliphilus]RQG88988.1 MFS transporter [Natrarchaeobius halalkaliphilus]
MKVRTVVGRELKAVWGDGRGVSLAVIAIGWGLLMGSRMILPVIIPYLQTVHGLSLTVAGLLVSVLWLFASVGQLPGGVLADKYDERTIMAGSVIVVAVALALVITAPTPLVLFLATALWGLGSSLYPIARITFLSNLYTERLGSALGLTMATADVGQTVFPPIATVLAVTVAWQAGLGFMIPLFVLAGIGLFVILSDRDGSDHPTGSGSLRDALDVLPEFRTPAMAYMTGILFLYFFIWQSFTAFYPTYLTTVKGLSPSVSSLLFGSFFAAGVLIKPLAGAAYDRIGARISLIAILVPPVAGFALLPFVDNVWLLVGITALVSTMLGSGAVTQPYLADSFSNEVKGTGLGTVKTITLTLASGGPVLFGVIADYGYFNEGYLVLAAVTAIVVVFTFWMPDSD